MTQLAFEMMQPNLLYTSNNRFASKSSPIIYNSRRKPAVFESVPQQSVLSQQRFDDVISVRTVYVDAGTGFQASDFFDAFFDQIPMYFRPFFEKFEQTCDAERGLSETFSKPHAPTTEIIATKNRNYGCYTLSVLHYTARPHSVERHVVVTLGYSSIRTQLNIISKIRNAVFQKLMRPLLKRIMQAVTNETLNRNDSKFKPGNFFTVCNN